VIDQQNGLYLINLNNVVTIPYRGPLDTGMTHILYNTKENNSPQNLATICPKIYISCIAALAPREKEQEWSKTG